YLLSYRGELLFSRPGGEDVAAVLGQPGEYLRHLRRRLAFTEDHLGHAHTQGAVMIHLGKAEIFKGQMPQALHGIVRRELATTYLIEKFADGFGVHGSTQHSAGRV